ncbi:opine metallophore biosynthesis dehydrogenase, partial [Staphylococcus aureus]
QTHVLLEEVESPLHAETRNSAVYMNPPQLMYDFSLQNNYEAEEVQVYVYKLFPEGPMTMTLIREMRLMWQDMMVILQ